MGLEAVLCSWVGSLVGVLAWARLQAVFQQLSRAIAYVPLLDGFIGEASQLGDTAWLGSEAAQRQCWSP